MCIGNFVWGKVVVILGEYIMECSGWENGFALEECVIVMLLDLVWFFA